MRASHALHLGLWPGESTQHGAELCGLLNGGYGVVCGGEEPFLSDNNPESFPAHRPEGVLISFVITNIDDQRTRRWPLSAHVLHQPAHGLPFVPPYVWSDFHHRRSLAERKPSCLESRAYQAYDLLLHRPPACGGHPPHVHGQSEAFVFDPDAGTMTQMVVRGLRHGHEFGAQASGVGMAVDGLRPGYLQAMIPHQIRDLAIDVTLEIRQGAPAHDGHPKMRMPHEERDHLAHRRTETRGNGIRHQGCQRPIIIEE
jgi:hypothetical protein